MVAYLGRLRSKGVLFLGFRHMKGLGNLSFWSVKGPNGLTDASHGREKLARKRSGPSRSEGGKAIRWINIYQLRSATGFLNTYLLDSDLSAG